MNGPEANIVPPAPAVSVVVPLYNKAPYVRRSLESIRRQTLTNLEVIVVNDGSTDDSERVAQSSIAEDPRFRLISQPNAGPGAARNYGATLARAPWIAFLDADDEWDPEYLRHGLALAEAQAEAQGDAPAAVTCGHCVNHMQHSTEALWRSRGLDDGIVRVQDDTAPQYLSYVLAYMSPCTTLFRREAFVRWGGFYENRCVYGEDSHLLLKILLNETVLLCMQPYTVVHADASGLANNLRRRTPVEPILTQPESIRAVCPPHLQGLLARLLAVRAFRRTVVLAYWGDWRAARALRARFRTPGDWRLPHFWRALLAANPLGAAAGFLVRRLLRKG